MIKRLFLFLSFFTLLLTSALAETVTTTITITNARQTSYKKDEVTGNDLILLEGSVQLSVQNGSSTSEIKADKITYDRKTEILYAEGNVEITTKSSSSGAETTSASSLLLNTATLEGVFDGGRVVKTQTDAINLPSGSTLIVFSDLFANNQTNTITFKNSSLTFCDEEIPHWHIDASRTWLLPGGEFAFFNALLYVGSVPVFYFPAFYYPKDELVFNPVFTYRTREGYSFQTTTYLYGRKPLDTSSSTSSDSSTDSLAALYNFMKPSSLKEQKLEGLVLHNLDKDYTGDTSTYAKLFVDWYSRLGTFAGFDSKFAPSTKYLTSLDLDFYMGFSNTVFNYGSSYLSYDPLTAEKSYDYSYFMGLKLPFRYAGNFAMTLSKPFKLTLSLPIYSDPFFAYDFLTNRSESMDWISYFMDSTSSQTVSITEVSSFAWNMTSSYSPTIPSFLKPYLSSTSFSLTSQIDISSKSASGLSSSSLASGKSSYWLANTPLRKFYYPSSVTPLSASFSLSGTIFQYPKASSTSKSNTASLPYSLNEPELIKAAAEEKSEEDKKEAADGEPAEESALAKESALAEGQKTAEESADESYFEPTLPLLATSSPTVTQIVPFTYKLSYNLSSTLKSQVSYDSASLTTAEDFQWKNIKSTMYTVKMPFTINSAASYYGNFLSLTNTLSYSPIWQGHPNTDGYSDTEKATLKLADYKAQSQTISNTNSLSFKPFAYTDMFADSGISWSSTIKLYQRSFTGDADNPEWDNLFVDWDDDSCVTVNSVNVTASVKESDNFKQSFVLTSILPPLLRQYTAKLNFTFPYTSLTLSTGLKETSKGCAFSEWTKTPFTQSLSFSKKIFNSTLSLSQSYTYNIENQYSDSLKFAFSWYNFSSSFVYSYSKGADFKGEDSGWEYNSDLRFRPYSLNLSYTPSSKTFYTWFNRITFTPTLTTSLTADLVIPTNSYFVFTPGLTFKITDFFYLTFSSTSRNSVLYRYFQKMLGHEGLIPGEENIFKDLLNSFAFGNEALRQASGFKLKSMNLTMTHELHDWTFNFTMKITPRMVIDGSQRYYDFSPYVSIGIVWTPMQSMKTTIIREPESSTSANVIWKLNSDS